MIKDEALLLYSIELPGPSNTVTRNSKVLPSLFVMKLFAVLSSDLLTETTFSAAFLSAASIVLLPPTFVHVDTLDILAYTSILPSTIL